MLSRMVVNDCVGDNRAQNGLHGGQTFKGPVRHKGVPVKAQLVSNSTVSRLNYPQFTSDHPGLSCSNALSRCRPVLHWNVFRLATHVHGGAMVLSPSWLTVDNPGQLEHGLSIEH